MEIRGANAPFAHPWLRPCYCSPASVRLATHTQTQTHRHTHTSTQTNTHTHTHTSLTNRPFVWYPKSVLDLYSVSFSTVPLCADGGDLCKVDDSELATARCPRPQLPRHFSEASHSARTFVFFIASLLSRGRSRKMQRGVLILLINNNIKLINFNNCY